MKIGEFRHRIFYFIKAKFSSIAALWFKILTTNEKRRSVSNEVCKRSLKGKRHESKFGFHIGWSITCIVLFICTFYLSVEYLVGKTDSIKEPYYSSYKAGEHLKWRVHYGFINAGFATLSLKGSQIDNKKHYHAVMKGWSTGIVNAFFKVKDQYESYFDAETKQPRRFIRKVNEGKYWNHREMEFNLHDKEVRVEDFKAKKVTTHSVTKNIQDMISAFYSLRETPIKQLKVGNEIKKNLFFDFEVYHFKIKILNKETIKTKFGYIDCLKVLPYVQSGKVFKEKESVTVWITNDSNLLPVRIKAELVIGSLKFDLYEYSGLSNKINFRKRRKSS